MRYIIIIVIKEFRKETIINCLWICELTVVLFKKARKEVHLVWLPVTITSIAAFYIAGCFMSVFEV